MNLYCYSSASEKICLTFYPCLNKGAGTSYDEAYSFLEPLKIYQTDYDRLIIPYLQRIFPIKDPTNQSIQDEFDYFFDNWIAKEDFFRFIALLEEREPVTPAESQFYSIFIGWVQKELSWAEMIMVEGNQ